jgi:hypothetical protein
MRLPSNDSLRVRRIDVEPSARPFESRSPLVSSSSLGDRVMASLTEFYASIADVTDEQHQNMAGLVQANDFNAEIVVRFLRDNGIDASVDESNGGFRKLESGKPADKRVLPALAAAALVPLRRAERPPRKSTRNCPPSPVAGILAAREPKPGLVSRRVCESACSSRGKAAGICRGGSKKDGHIENPGSIREETSR